MVKKYKDRYPSLTPELLEDEVRHYNNMTSDPPSSSTPVPSVSFDETASRDCFSALTRSTGGPGAGDGDDASIASGPSRTGEVSLRPTRLMDEDEAFDNSNKIMTVTYDQPNNHDRPYEEILRIPPDAMVENQATPKQAEEPPKKKTCWSKRKQEWNNFKAKCRENGGYNLLTFTFLLSFITILMFITSVVYTYLNFNQESYRDWALAGGVTSTSANFRVRGPSSDDGKAREFVVSTNPNLAIEKDQITNIPVSYGDFTNQEHYVKRLQLNDLSPLTPYYYGITRPKRTPNSAIVAGDVGTFTTPAPEGTRMDFTIATGSCALTGSKSNMFADVLDLDPLMFIHMGDFHYEDLNTLNIDERLEAYDKTMGSPSQRLLYMRTIFAYIWDDHDWLGNNQDSDDEEAASIAKQTYTLGIPHYPLGSNSVDEANAAKYQAFTIGTVRFIITDLRSESIKSSEYYSGKVYSKEQKAWLFNELSQAENYDFVIWVTTRPWTDPAKVGSDTWGGFVSDRDELSSYIASTIGSGPRNLFVLSGDNHMVAFDDGSSTDYSGQDRNPGGFPLLHSGPMTNYGSGVVDFFNPSANYFTDGCMAFNSELNHQFSTLTFTFPRDEPCIQIRSYSKDSSNVIFEREICGETMRYGTPEEDTCTLKKLTVPTQYVFIAAAGLIVLSAFLATWFLGFSRCHIAMRYFGIGILYYLFTIAAAIAGAFCFGTLGVNMLAVASFVLAQAFIGSLFVGKAVFCYCRKEQPTDKQDEGVNTIEKDEEIVPKEDVEVVMNESGDQTHDDTLDDAVAPAVLMMGDSRLDRSDSREIHSVLSPTDNSDSRENTSSPEPLGQAAVEPKSDARENIDISSPETTAAVLCHVFDDEVDLDDPALGEMSTVEYEPKTNAENKPTNALVEDERKESNGSPPEEETAIANHASRELTVHESAQESEGTAILRDLNTSESRESTRSPSSLPAKDATNSYFGRSKSTDGLVSPSQTASSPRYYNTSQSLEERVAAVLTGVGSFFSDGKSTGEAEADSLAENSRIEYEQEAVQDETEEGVEVTYPSSSLTSKIDIKVSPSLYSL